MHLLSFAVVAFLVGLSTAKQCINQTVPVTISARTSIFNIAVPQTNMDAITFILNETQQGRNFNEVALAGYQTTSGTYSISTEMCIPDGCDWKVPPSGVQVLTHGIGFDKTYWDLSFNNYNYSYVDVATDRYHYATLSYDRLGIGMSSHGEPLDEIQASLEIAVLAELTMMLRNGSFPSLGQPFSKVIHVGHSFGSAQTYGLVSLDPTLSDGIVLTGFSMNASFVGLFFAGGKFVLANSISALAVYPNGYLAAPDTEAVYFNFFYPNYFDPALLVLAAATGEPVTVGELLTLGSAPLVNPYSGPVLVFTGDHDVPYCGGNCLATGDPALSSIPAAVSKNFPNVPPAKFEAYIQPNTGHGLNFHYNATAGYEFIQQWLVSKGL